MPVNKLVTDNINSDQAKLDAKAKADAETKRLADEKAKADADAKLKATKESLNKIFGNPIGYPDNAEVKELD
jgi:membrane protein involved in colicin uptake